MGRPHRGAPADESAGAVNAGAQPQDGTFSIFISGVPPAGQNLCVSWLVLGSLIHWPTPIPISVNLPTPEFLFDDSVILVVNKPAGLSTQAPPGIDSLEVRVKAFLQQRATQSPRAAPDPSFPPDTVYLGVPHRLDRPASGALVMATTRAATRKLSRQFEHRQVTKRYWALVECLTPAVAPDLDGTLVDFMRKVPGEPRSEVVAAEHPDAQLARLHCRTLGQHDGVRALEIELETGRTHQIRLQLAHRGWPIVGDRLYGATSDCGVPPADWRARPIALHARFLKLVHPGTKDEVQITAPVPPVWRELFPIA